MYVCNTYIVQPDITKKVGQERQTIIEIHFVNTCKPVSPLERVSWLFQPLLGEEYFLSRC